MVGDIFSRTVERGFEAGDVVRSGEMFRGSGSGGKHVAEAQAMVQKFKGEDEARRFPREWLEGRWLRGAARGDRGRHRMFRLRGLGEGWDIHRSAGGQRGGAQQEFAAIHCGSYCQLPVVGY
jgi:hypothetical protein